MNVSSINNIKFCGNTNKPSANKSDSKEYLKQSLISSGYLAGGTASGFTFSFFKTLFDGQKVAKQIKQENINKENAIEEELKETIKKRISWGEEIPDEEEQNILRGLYRNNHMYEYNEKIKNINEEFSKNISRNVRLYSCIGLSLGVLGLVARQIIKKNPTKDKIQANTPAINKTTSLMG